MSGHTPLCRSFPLGRYSEHRRGLRQVGHILRSLGSSNLYIVQYLLRTLPREHHLNHSHPLHSILLLQRLTQSTNQILTIHAQHQPLPYPLDKRPHQILRACRRQKGLDNHKGMLLTPTHALLPHASGVQLHRE
ncbi:MAG: hypothetical protein GY772_16140, partial [bacterium]|nr:hypothetical protein [bacterium]